VSTLGKRRGIGFGIVVYVVTLGIYGLYWVYVTFDELKRWIFPFGILIVPAIVWWVKVQGALNRYWESQPAEAHAVIQVSG